MAQEQADDDADGERDREDDDSHHIGEELYAAGDSFLPAGPDSRAEVTASGPAAVAGRVRFSCGRTRAEPAAAPHDRVSIGRGTRVSPGRAGAVRAR
ncbi:hypothetical protein TBS_28080 [Thermobispora bispora]